MRLLECLVKKVIIDKICPASCVTKIRKEGKEYFLERESTRFDPPVYMAMVQCYRVFGMDIQVLVYDRYNFPAFTHNRENEKEFIIQHELAHIRLKHFKHDIENMSWDERLQLEIDADTMAAKNMSPEIAINTLEQLRAFFEILIPSATDDQIDDRLKSLRNMLEAN